MSRGLAIVEGVFGRAYLLDKDRHVGPHAHPEPHIVLKIAGADFDYEVGGTLAPCRRDRIVLVNALELHHNHCIGKAPSIILSLYLSPHWLVERHPSLLAGGRLFRQPSCPTPTTVRQRADRLAAHMAQAEQVPPERLQFLVSELVLGVFEHCGPTPEQLTRAGPLNDHRIRRAAARMRAEVDRSPDLSAIAAHVSLSRSRFFELFAACTGLAPKQYLDMLRMDAAIAALARSGRSIAEIADACGYSAQSHFTRFFVQQLGITPGEYRRAALATAQHADDSRAGRAGPRRDAALRTCRAGP